MASSLGPVTLDGRVVRLEPLRVEQAAAMWESGQPREIWDHLSVAPDSLAAMRAYIADALKAAAEDREYAFVVLDAGTGRTLGSTRYLNVNHQYRTVEIGWTWYTPDVWQTKVNPEAKLLLLRHAFVDWGAIRVSLVTDVRNLHSQAAIRKLGAQYEGTLRQTQRRRDGTFRDTVVFSIVNGEWPEVEAGLLRRLA